MHFEHPTPERLTQPNKSISYVFLFYAFTCVYVYEHMEAKESLFRGQPPPPTVCAVVIELRLSALAATPLPSEPSFQTFHSIPSLLFWDQGLILWLRLVLRHFG